MPSVGQPCKKWAVNGSDFCPVHGGSPKKGLGDPSSFVNRCSATNRFGEQCRNPSIRGGTVCRSHGGASPQVKKKARERLLEMVEPALVQLSQIMEKPSTSDSDRLRAIQMVLDRTGYGPGHTLEVEVKPWELTMQRIVKELPSVDMVATPEPAYDPEDIEDAEVIEDHHPRDYLPQIVPPTVLGESATIRIGSAQPPRRQ